MLMEQNLQLGRWGSKARKWGGVGNEKSLVDHFGKKTSKLGKGGLEGMIVALIEFNKFS